MTCREIPGCGWCKSCQSEQAQDKYLETRTVQIRDLLIKRGKPEDIAEAVGYRAARMEVNQLLRWD